MSYFRLIRCYERQFIEISAKFPEPPQEEAGQASVLTMIWKILSSFVTDPFPEVAKLADSIVRFISDKQPKMNGQNVAPSSPKSVRVTSIKLKVLFIFNYRVILLKNQRGFHLDLH